MATDPRHGDKATCVCGTSIMYSDRERSEFEVEMGIGQPRWHHEFPASAYAACGFHDPTPDEIGESHRA